VGLATAESLLSAAISDGCAVQNSPKWQKFFTPNLEVRGFGWLRDHALGSLLDFLCIHPRKLGTSMVVNLAITRHAALMPRDQAIGMPLS
jgi:hypothetical protein